MADRITSGNASPPTSEADLGAFFRGRADVPAVCGAALIGSLSRLRGSDDPVVTFGRLPAACVPEFADGCEVELSDGAEPLFRVRYPASLDSGPEPVTTHRVGPDQVVSTPFRGEFQNRLPVVCRGGHALVDQPDALRKRRCDRRPHGEAPGIAR